VVRLQSVVAAAASADGVAREPARAGVGGGDQRELGREAHRAHHPVDDDAPVFDERLTEESVARGRFRLGESSGMSLDRG